MIEKMHFLTVWKQKMTLTTKTVKIVGKKWKQNWKGPRHCLVALPWPPPVPGFFLAFWSSLPCWECTGTGLLFPWSASHPYLSASPSASGSDPSGPAGPPSSPSPTAALLLSEKLQQSSPPFPTSVFLVPICAIGFQVAFLFDQSKCSKSGIVDYYSLHRLVRTCQNHPDIILSISLTETHIFIIFEK